MSDERRERLLAQARAGMPLHAMIEQIDSLELDEDEYGALWLYCWSLARARENETLSLAAHEQRLTFLRRMT